jgi:acyl phosphate:glycerol-3-phosphate acyltransferase
MNIFTLIIGTLAYLIGAIPTGYLIAKFKGISDIREHGSGNIGATNVSRILGKHYFFLIFFIDAGKAYLFIQAIRPYFDFNYLCFFAGILLFGNGCSLFLRGSGGKGVATLFGLLIALSKQTAVLLFGIWALLLLMTHTIGIASAATAAWLPFIAYRIHNPPLFLFSLFAACWIIQAHRTNIAAYWNKE